MGEIPFAPDGQRQPNKVKPEDVRKVEKNIEAEKVTPKKTRDKTVRRPVESPKSVSKKNDGLKQAEYLGDFFEKVAPVRIAVEIVEDYKKQLGKEITGIDKNKYDDPVEYEIAVRNLTNKISRVFKIFDEKLNGMYRVEDWRGEASVHKIELDNVFEGKNIVFATKDGDVAEKEYTNMLKFQEFLPNNLPKIYDYLRLGRTGILIMEKIEGKTMSHLLGNNAYKNTEAALKAKPELFFDLGKIIAVMDNNNFIHADLHFDNIMLSDDYVWKLTDFELSRTHKEKREAIKFFTNVEHFVLVEIINKISNEYKNKPIKNDFYEGYLLNRDLKEDIRFVSEEKLIDFDASAEYMKRMVGVVKNVSAPSKELRDYLNSLREEIGGSLKEPVKDEIGVKSFKKRSKILKDFKNGIEKFLENKTGSQ
jgi:tRNA A-37 threonylcarbamoyl transferase component Bud32